MDLVPEEVLYGGDDSTVLEAEPGQSRDAVLVVRYPSRRAFRGVVRDPEYQSGSHLRIEALVEGVLQATSSST